MLQELRTEALSLEAQDVRFAFDGVPALAGVHLRVVAGRCVALVGESGAGKTTLLRCFNRMVAPSSGSVLIGGVPVSAQPVEQLRRQVGYVPQHGGLLPHWTVSENASMVPELLESADAATSAQRALAIVGLPLDTFADRFPHELS